MARALGDPMADIIDRIVARHVLLLQEIRGVRLTFGENGDQHVRARHLFPARRLNMEGRSLYDPLEAVGRLGLFLAVDDEVLKLRIEIMDDGLAQRVEVDAAGSQHCGRVDVVDQRQQQMLQRRILMTPFIGERQRPAKGLLECAGENRHRASHFFSMMH